MNLEEAAKKFAVENQETLHLVIPMLHALVGSGCKNCLPADPCYTRQTLPVRLSRLSHCDYIVGVLFDPAYILPACSFFCFHFIVATAL